MYRRLGNMVLDYCTTAKSKHINEDYKLRQYQRQRWNDKARKDWLFKKAIHFNEKVTEEAWSSFDKFERALGKAEFDRLVSQGYIDIDGTPINQGAEIGG